MHCPRFRPLKSAVPYLAASALGVLPLLVTGCSTKNYVRSQTTPVIQHTNELDDETRANNRNIHDVEQRANLKLAVGHEYDELLGALEFDGRLRPFEVVPLADLLLGLVDGIVDLLEVDTGGYVE